MIEHGIGLFFSSIAFIALILSVIKRSRHYMQFDDHTDAEIINVEENSNDGDSPYKLRVFYNYAGKNYEEEAKVDLIKRPIVGSTIKIKLCKSQPDLIGYFGENNWSFWVLIGSYVLVLLGLLCFIVSYILWIWHNGG